MRKKIAALFFSLVIMVSFVIGLASCQGLNTSKNGHIPVYQGMTISDSPTKAVPTKFNRIRPPMEDPGNTDNNGNHNGWYKGDHEDKDEEVDKDDPFPDNDDDENIENEVHSSLTVVGADHEIYYATKNVDVYIHIHLNNPDNYEIVSFTLNGKKYSSYMFEDGSDMETLILKCNVGDESGIQEYTIDAIKYIDGTQIKDVVMDGEKTVIAGIKAEGQVTASVSNLSVETNAFGFNVNVTDNDGLIAYSKGSIKAVLYDGETLLATKDLTLGNNSVQFDKLTTNGLYQYAIIGYYDDLSGKGFGMNVLYKDALYTKAVVLFADIELTQDSIQFSLLWNENFQNKHLTKLTLHQGESRTELSPTATFVDGLLSNTEYSLVANYKNGTNTESISLTFTTGSKSIPTFEIVNPTKTQTSVAFEIQETDTDNVGEVTKIELVHTNGTIVADNVNVRDFTGLLSNNTYTVKVTYSYNLNDGAGAQESVKTLDITTDAKAIPTIEIINPSKTQTSVAFEINEVDKDNVGEVTKIELVHTNGTIVADNVNVRDFTGLLSNNTYTVKVTYSYNLNDGVGAQESVKTLDITTDAKAIPTIEIINPSKTQTSVAFEIQETDTDNVGEVTKIELVHANGTVVADNVSVREFTSLLSNNTYTVQATYTYNLNDGVGAQEIIKTLEITTGAKATPSIEIVNPTKTQTSVAFEINEVDTDNIGEITKIELYDAVQNTILSTLLDFENLYFGGLSPYTKYSVAITYQYNLNDGIGNQTAVQFYVFYTMPVVECTAMEILNTATVFEGDTIVLQLNVNNPSTVSFKQAKVNGEYYAVDVSSNTTVLVRIEYKEQFAGGETVLTVEELIGKIGEETLSWTITNNNQDSILIAGKLTVESIVLVNKNYEEIKYAFPSEEVGVLITLNNPTGYTISATSLGNNIVNIDSNHIFIPQTLTSGGTVKSLYYISYHNGEVNNELRLSRPISTQWVYCIASSDIVEVTSAEQLFNMDDGYYYKLMNDIDLSSYQWINAGNLNGVLDGNGYAIKNMRNTSTVIDQHLEISLFYTAEGYIINLDVENCFIDAITTSLTDRYYYAGFGGFAFNGTYVAENCSFNYDTSINGNSCIGDIIDGIHYQIGDGVATVISCSEGIQKAVILESITINGKSYPVTTIDSGAFRSCVYLTSVIIPNSVTRIGNSAFNGCSNLTNLVIGDNVTTIDPFAFANCSSLTSIVLPNSVTTIGSFAFQSCTILTSISIPDSVTTIDSYAFEDCVGLTSIVIPNSVTSIGAEAFSGCSNLNNIVLSNNLTAISDGMFRACRSLTNIIIPNSVTSIGADAFRGVPLTSIVIPSNVASIGRLAFGYCSTLESVVIARTGARMTINTAAFDGCQGLTSIIIPARVAYIKSEAFYNCQNLTIYCEASSKPSGWASDWNLLLYGQVDVCPVVWGYQPEIQP